jgi:hypothetical protein
MGRDANTPQKHGENRDCRPKRRKKRRTCCAGRLFGPRIDPDCRRLAVAAGTDPPGDAGSRRVVYRDGRQSLSRVTSTNGVDGSQIATSTSTIVVQDSRQAASVNMSTVFAESRVWRKSVDQPSSGPTFARWPRWPRRPSYRGTWPPGTSARSPRSPRSSSYKGTWPPRATPPTATRPKR